MAKVIAVLLFVVVPTLITCAALKMVVVMVAISPLSIIPAFITYTVIIIALVGLMVLARRIGNGVPGGLRMLYPPGVHGNPRKKE